MAEPANGSALYYKDRVEQKIHIPERRFRDRSLDAVSAFGIKTRLVDIAAVTSSKKRSNSIIGAVYRQPAFTR